MTLLKLRYVLEIDNTGSMNEAAKRLFLSQSSLSSAVRELEEEMGIEIFQRTNRGVLLSPAGVEFLRYARQVVEQADLLEQRYRGQNAPPRHFAVSTQHYAFVVKAFVRLVEQHGGEDYEFFLRDTRTREVLEDVRGLRSEVGVLYRNEFNAGVLGRLMAREKLEFHPLFTARPHVFLSTENPLAAREAVTLADLEDYPCLTFEQGDYQSFYFSEEILSTLPHRKTIQVSDRATIFNLMIGLNGYTVSTGVMCADLNGDNIVAVPLLVDEEITVGWVAHKSVALSPMATAFIAELEKAVKD